MRNLKNMLNSVLAFCLVLVALNIQAAPVVQYIHTDTLGSPIASTNDQGELLWREEYQPLGERIVKDTASVSRKAWYTGHVEDKETGLVYMGARFYDPQIGRFLSPDPVGFSDANPMQFNRYAYANNNPYRYVDPDGNIAVQAAKFILDFSLNVAINYASTGEADVMGAAMDSVKGIFNPAASILKIQKIKKIYDKAGGVTKGVSTGAENANAGAALNRKLSALEGAQQNAARVRELPDGRIRYYEAERAARNPGPTRGSSYVTEYNPANGNVRSWNEAYDQAGNVNRVHPKMINGQTVNSQHYPPTARELGLQ